ncbi:hypothetical protein HMPREF0868_1333 [Mageeibacillus indolicus UPII9-5]|uniref:Uncharacterized protein n=1 Tax=Mageeibacillus indolicus (strain UPII9-5) TaxID=699246 RepID=D3R339_MAGIU|nr:hypothetical protein HMPREF0868_1333 [Mageeibacillus indolicus UPII9-5]
MIEPCIFVEYIVGSVYTFTLFFYFCKLFKVHFIYTPNSERSQSVQEPTIPFVW